MLFSSLYSSGSGSTDPNECGSDRIQIHIATTYDNYVWKTFQNFVNLTLLFSSFHTLDPDPRTQIYADPTGSGSTSPLHMIIMYGKLV